MSKYEGGQAPLIPVEHSSALCVPVLEHFLNTVYMSHQEHILNILVFIPEIQCMCA